LGEVNVDRYDVLAIAGALVLSVGVGMIHPAFGVIVLGATLLGMGLLGARLASSR
jgi:hypothetical protein